VSLFALRCILQQALTDPDPPPSPHSRKSSLTTESLESYRDLIMNATVDLEHRLQVMDEKLESTLEHTVMSDSDAAELRQIKEKQLSTQKCLQVCAQLSEHTDQIQLPSIQRGQTSPPSAEPERVTSEGLRECKAALSLTAAKLERRTEHLISRLVAKSKTAVNSEEDAAELARLSEDWETARHCRDICSKADTNLNEDITVVENFATNDDAVQFLVSTNGKIIRGKNRGYGLRTKQVGGYLSDDSLQKVSRDLARMGVQNTGDDGPYSRDKTPPPPDGVGNGPSAEFRDRWGRGFKLASTSTPDTAPADGGANCSRQR